MTNTETSELLSKPWQKFFVKLQEANTVPVPQWKPHHLLGYFCNQYQDYYGKPFALSLKTSAPSKCPELYMIKRTMVMLDTVDPEVTKQYIDWVFKSKIGPQKMHIRSIGLLATPSFANEFNFRRTKKETITRSTPLPQQYKQIIDRLNVPAQTYGDLAFAWMAKQSGNKQYDDLFASLQIAHFNPDVVSDL